MGPHDKIPTITINIANTKGPIGVAAFESTLSKKDWERTRGDASPLWPGEQTMYLLALPWLRTKLDVHVFLAKFLETCTPTPSIRRQERREERREELSKRQSSKSVIP